MQFHLLNAIPSGIVSFKELARRKHPDYLADSCKRLSVNQMAAGSRLPRSSHGFFLLSPTFHFVQLI